MKFIGLVTGVFIALLLIPASVSAQVYYPGTVWNQTGTVSPVEKGNVVTMTHFEQGIALQGAELFSQTTVQYDSKGYDWNRRTILGIGGRYTLKLPKGVVRGGLSYLSEKRYITGSIANGFSLTVDAWFGWNSRPVR